MIELIMRLGFTLLLIAGCFLMLAIAGALIISFMEDIRNRNWWSGAGYAMASCGVMGVVLFLIALFLSINGYR